MLSDMNSKNEELRKQMEMYKKFSHFNDKSTEIVRILENDANSLFIITHSNTFDWKGRLKYGTFQGHLIQNSNNLLSNPVITLEYEAVYSNCQNGEVLSHLYIIDFLTKHYCDENHGYGTKLMTAFIDYAKNKRFPAIKGWLAPVDLNKPNNKARLYHFYNEKFGFFIDENEKIYLQIQKKQD